jgi:hypothetical protein
MEHYQRIPPAMPLYIDEVAQQELEEMHPVKEREIDPVPQ